MSNVPQSPGSARWRKSTYSFSDGNCVECAPGPGTVWRKATASAGNGACVEVAGLPASSHSGPVEAFPRGIYVRDSKDPDGGCLHFAAADWQAFVDRLRNRPLEVPA